MKRRTRIILLVGVGIALLAVTWLLTGPPSGIIIGGPVEVQLASYPNGQVHVLLRAQRIDATPNGPTTARDVVLQYFSEQGELTNQATTNVFALQSLSKLITATNKMP